MPWYEIEYQDFAPVAYDGLWEHTWYQDLLAYFKRTYPSIEKRMIDTFRYVDCDPRNGETFSYEYGSILRDAGSCFGSVMDKLVRAVKPGQGNLGIGDYTEWLSKGLMKYTSLDGRTLDSIEHAGAEIRTLLDRRLLRKFLPHTSFGRSPRWWNAYNNVKHSDLEKFHEGNLQNCLNALAAVASLWHICERSAEVQLFRTIGLFSPSNYRPETMFCVED